MVLQKELATHRRELPNMVAEHAGDYVLIHGDQVVRSLADEDSAWEEGVERSRPGPVHGPPGRGAGTRLVHLPGHPPAMPSLTGGLTVPHLGMAAGRRGRRPPYHEARRPARSGAAVPRPHRARVLLDSGSCFTLIDPAVVQALGLVPFNTTTIYTPHSGPNPPHNNQHRVDLAAPTRLATPQRPGSLTPYGRRGRHLAPLGYQVIIGTNVLSSTTSSSTTDGTPRPASCWRYLNRRTHVL